MQTLNFKAINYLGYEKREWERSIKNQEEYKKPFMFNPIPKSPINSTSDKSLFSQNTHIIS